MGLSYWAVTIPNSPARVPCFALRRSDWFGGQISRQIGIGNYAMCANDHGPPEYRARFAA
jgi:hypothetical protein